ncbi:MAG TPA: response regulator transcription factor [Verrucomicrobiae bacterium]|nr:response regulator transcription factor [Verrucomicrobiae bacterium]
MQNRVSKHRKKTGAFKRTVLLMDGHSVVREGLASIINDTPDLVVCGQSDSAADAMSAVSALNPDAAVVNISLDGSIGLELIQTLKATYPRLAIVASVLHDEEELAKLAMKAGASSFITRGNVIEPVRRALASA